MTNFYSTEALKNIPHIGDGLALLPPAFATARSMKVTSTEFASESRIYCYVDDEKTVSFRAGKYCGLIVYYDSQAVKTVKVDDMPIMGTADVATEITPDVTCIIRTRVVTGHCFDYLQFVKQFEAAILPFERAALFWLLPEADGQSDIRPFNTFKTLLPFLAGDKPMLVWQPKSEDGIWILTSSDSDITPYCIIDGQRACGALGIM